MVFSHTLRDPLEWANSTLISTDATAAVRSLKQESQTPLRTIGSPTLCRSLLAAGLVDKYQLVVFPVVNGATGTDPIYAGWPDVALDLVDNRTFDGRLQLFKYVLTILDGPPARPHSRTDLDRRPYRVQEAENASPAQGEGPPLVGLSSPRKQNVLGRFEGSGRDWLGAVKPSPTPRPKRPSSS